MHLDALGGAAPVDGAESALPELVAVVEVVGRLQELLQAVDLPWILYTPALRCPRRIRPSNSSGSVTGRFISSTDRDIRDAAVHARDHEVALQILMVNEAYMCTCECDDRRVVRRLAQAHHRRRRSRSTC